MVLQSRILEEFCLQDSEYLDPRAQRIHGRDTTEFPDLIHGKDLPSIQNRLRQFPCQRALLWQSAWMTREAMLALNQRGTAIRAISFEREEPQAPEREKKDCFSTMTRALGKEFKKIVGKKSGKS